MTTDAFTPWVYQFADKPDVHIKWRTPDAICAVVRDDSGVFDVHQHGGRWSCTCRVGTTCSHLAAVMSVTNPLAVMS